MPCRCASELLPRFLEGTLGAQDRATLVAHLETECAECEEALLRMGGDPVAEGLRRRAEALHPGPADPTPQEQEAAFARVMREVPLPAAIASAPPKPERIPCLAWLHGHLGLAAAAAACLVLLSAGLWLWPGGQPPGNSGQTLKGDRDAARTPQGIALWFDVAGLDQGRRVLKGRGVDGGRYRPDDFIVLRYRLEHPGFLAVVHVDAEGRPRVIYRGTAPEGAGNATLTVDGVEAAFPLQGLSGRQRFIAVVSPEPLGDDRLGSGAYEAGAEGTAVARVVLEVAE